MRPFHIVPVLLSLALTCYASPNSSVEEQDQARFKVVRDYADTVLKDAADRYHTNPSPLLANGINVFTKEHLLWNYSDGTKAVICDFTQHQNLLRILCALSNLTGEPKYKNAARAEIAYFFAHLQDKGGLLYWGGHRFVDLKTLKSTGFSPTDEGVHELKNVFPYYELMYEVDAAATARLITGFWNAHVYNWHTLEISRHGSYGKPPGAQWTNSFDDPKPFFETKGLSFLDAGNDLIYSGAMLYRLSGDKGALLWSKRLAHQYIKARDPKTRLGAYQFTQPRKTAEATNDSATFSWFGDRAKRQFGPEFPDHLVLEATMLLNRLASTIYSENALMELELVQTLGPDGKEFRDWVDEGMAAFARLAYVPDQNLLRPMLTDGTDLSSFVVKRNGYYARAGTRLTQYPATPEFMISYARGFLVTGDTNLWSVARGIAKSAGLGDIGTVPGKEVHLDLETTNSDAFALFSLLDIYRQTQHKPYLELARAVGNNIVHDFYHHGYFTRYDDQIYANIDVIEPYALLALDAAIKQVPDKVPYFINGSGYVDAEYLFPDGKARRTRDAVLYRPRLSTSHSPAPGFRDPNAAAIEAQPERE